ncbi:MAG: DUF2249 domain-containing protein [Wolinella sp.]
MREIRIDVSTLEHPEPLQIITRSINELNDSEYIRMIHRMEPLPLYDILHSRGFVYRVKLDGDMYHILIAKSIDLENLREIEE